MSNNTSQQGLPSWLSFRRTMPAGARWKDGTKYQLANSVFKVDSKREIKSTVLLDFKGDLYIKDMFHECVNGERKSVVAIIRGWRNMKCLDVCQALLQAFNGSDSYIMSDLTSILQRWYVEQGESNPFMVHSLKKL